MQRAIGLLAVVVVLPNNVQVLPQPLSAERVLVNGQSGGLVVEGRSFFPIGFWCNFRTAPQDWPRHVVEEESPYGFNFVAPYLNPEGEPRTEAVLEEFGKFLDLAEACGFKVLYNLGDHLTFPESRREGDFQRIEREVTRFRSHPAILSWYLADEPELRADRMPASQFQKAQQLVRSLDISHPTSVVFCSTTGVEAFAQGVDLIGADFYAVPTYPASRFAAFTEEVRKVAGARPLWMVTQTFTNTGGLGEPREPTPEEERAMVYGALVHGAKGISFFSYEGASPTLWNEARRLSLEVSQLGPVLLAKDAPTQVASNLSSVHALTKEYRGDTYLIAVNLEPKPVTVAFAVPTRVATAEAEVLFENREVMLKDGGLSDVFSGYSSHVYRLAGKTTAPSGLAKDNLLTNPGFESTATLLSTPPGWLVAGFQRWRPHGARCLVDMTEAAEGLRSLKVCRGVGSSPIAVYSRPVPMAAEEAYDFSLSLRANRPKVALQLFAAQANKRVEVDTAWAEHRLSVAVPPATSGSATTGTVGFRVIGQGTVWADAARLSVSEASRKANLAYHRPAGATSHYGDYRPELATDGDYDTAWISSAPLPQALTLDLGSIRSIRRVLLRHWKELRWNRDFTIEVSQDGKAFSRAAEVKGNWLLQTRHEFQPVPARFVRVTVQADGAAAPAKADGLARLLEIRVIGE